VTQPQCSHDALLRDLREAPWRVSYARGQRATASETEWIADPKGAEVAWCPRGHWVQVVRTSLASKKPAPQSEERAG
jgi:hypothetical protein